MKRIFNGIKVEIVKGDIANQPDVDAVVNAANAELRTGGGVAGALHQAAGKELEEACKPFAPIEPGEVVTTEAFNLPNKYVIHCLGPVYGEDENESVLLSDCYRNALQEAEEYQLSSVAFPSISTGAFGYPMKEAALTAFSTILEEITRLDHVKVIRFVLFSHEHRDIHLQALQQAVDETR